MKTKKVKTKVTKYEKQEDEMDVYLDNLLDEHGITYEAIFGKEGAFKMMQKRLLELNNVNERLYSADISADFRGWIISFLRPTNDI